MIDELLAHARAQFVLSQRQKDGATLRQHLEAVERRSQVRPKQLEVPPLPPELAHVWEWFNEVHSRRGSNGYGANPITYAEIESWGRLTKRSPNSLEVGLMCQLDDEYLEPPRKGESE